MTLNNLLDPLVVIERAMRSAPCDEARVGDLRMRVVRASDCYVALVERPAPNDTWSDIAGARDIYRDVAIGAAYLRARERLIQEWEQAERAELEADREYESARQERERLARERNREGGEVPTAQDRNPGLAGGFARYEDGRAL